MSISMRLEGKPDLSRMLKKAIQAMAKDYNKELKQHTPKGRTGNASRGWRLRRTQQGSKIKNTVDYIEVLNAGRQKAPHRKGMQGSKKAPDGMTKPARKIIRENIRAGKYKMKRRK